MNSPLVEMVPIVAFPPVTPFTDHSTAVFVVFETVAVSVDVMPSKTDVFVAVMLMPIGGLPGGADGFAPARPHPLHRKSAKLTAKYSHTFREAHRRGGRVLVNTAAFESKANAAAAGCSFSSASEPCADACRFRSECKYP